MESQGSKREKTLFSFFKPRESASTTTSEGHSPSNADISDHQPPLSKSRRVEIDLSTLEWDPGIRIPIWQHYHFDVFNSAIDFQQEELNSRFSDEAVELLILSSALEPKENFKSFKVDDICKLAEKFYPEDFSEQEMHYLRCQLNHYKIDVLHHQSFQNVSTITELCRGLVETNKLQTYNLIDRLIRLVLTLPVSIATTERAFSAMKHVKTALRNKMEEEFLANSMMIYIEQELLEDIDSDSIIDEFYSTKYRRMQLK